MQLKDPSSFVIATARNTSAPELTKLASKFSKDRLALVQLDVVNPKSVASAVAETEKLLPNGLDYLINNAGVNGQPTANVLNL